jgi:hypothetical protein
VAFMNATDDKTADQAAEIQSTLARDADRARSNGNLSDQGRLSAIAAAYLRATAEMDQLRQGFQGGRDQRAEVLEVDLFGAPSTVGADAISARDADDRSASLNTADEALALLQRAEVNGDKVLARAIALRAYGESRSPIGGWAWGPVVDAYTARRPEVAAKMAELTQARRRDVQVSLGRAFIFIVDKPREIGRLSDTQIRALANQASAPSEA